MIHTGQEPRTLVARLAQLDAAEAVRRAWGSDFTLWGDDPREISNRLGWLRAPESMCGHVEPLRRFAESLVGQYDAVALLGMGGSSLAPETLDKTHRERSSGPRLTILDTTHPDAVRDSLAGLDPERTIHVVSTKSGTTTETLMLFRIVYRWVVDALGAERAGTHFVAITDPGSPLERLAHEKRFRSVFLNDPTIGGRYAALSLVGLVPAALLGLDLAELLNSAHEMSCACGPSIRAERNPAAFLAAWLAGFVDEGRDKATFKIQDPLSSFGDWVEQLLAESTGKRGSGVLPVVGEPTGAATSYGTDRVFVRLGSTQEVPGPYVDVDIPDVRSLGAQFFLWELTTAFLGHLLKVNPFDQPDVESSKEATRRILAAYRERGERPQRECTQLTAEALAEFAALTRPGDYIALLAYLNPLPETRRRLQALRRTLRDRTCCATTLGFGPRYLHSTGQLHKGDSGQGLFLLLVDDPTCDISIPDEVEPPLGLRLLVRAQALGDAAALRNRDRRLLVADLGRDSNASLGALDDAFSSGTENPATRA